MGERGKADAVTAVESVAEWLRHLPLPALLVDDNGVPLTWNAGATALLGWEDARSIHHFGGPVVPWFARLRSAARSAGTGHVIVTRQRRGERLALDVTARYIAPGELLVLITDVTALSTARREARSYARELRRAEAGLRTSQERIRLITDAVHDHATVTLDGAGRIVSWNAGAQRLTGFTAGDVMQQPFGAVLVQEVSRLEEVLRHAALSGRDETELTLRRHDRSTYQGRITASALHDSEGAMSGFVIVLRDLTEAIRAADKLRRSEEQLQRSQKMDAIGRLSAGIAHDFNNVLTAIHGHVEFLLTDLPPDLPAREDVEEIRRAAERATALTRQLLTCARRQVMNPVPLDVNTVVRDIQGMLRRLITADIGFETLLDPDVPLIFADPSQLEQVLLNLIVNARDAITHNGTIAIRTTAMHFAESYAARDLQLTPGDYVQLTVSDTGAGMNNEVQRQIFEPFFTTKPDGTGLGLSTVYGIVKQTGGHISVYSEESVGTTFKVFFPVYNPNVAPAPLQAPASSIGAGTVLVVEDDDAVRGLARRTLQGSGYAVVEAREGEEALLILSQRSGEIDVVVTDVNMPNLSGYELANRIAHILPRAGVVIMSGFSEESAPDDLTMHRRRRFLEKPFTPVSLVRAVREAMEE